MIDVLYLQYLIAKKTIRVQKRDIPKICTLTP